MITILANDSTVSKCRYEIPFRT